MHLATFLQDLAVMMIVAGIVTVIFHRLKQPVVLGYIISGIIIGPHTPPFSFLYDQATVKTLGEIGVIFLMFSLGLEFSVRKIFHLGSVVLTTAAAEIIFMVFIGYQMGKWFGWRPIDAFFLGAMLAISSTTIIIKALRELGMKKEEFAQTVFGILIVEDILAIAILALLSSISVSGNIDVVNVFTTLIKLIAFLVLSLVIGNILVPRLLTYIAKFRSKEMLLIAVLGICFGFCLIVIKLGYSVALGAFLIGSIMSESEEIETIKKLISPLTNMFSAIFFISIGLLVSPKVIWVHIVPVLVLTFIVVIGKVFVTSLCVFLEGRDGKTSLRIGMSLAQIGEFSFIIASLGVALKVTSSFLYPIIVAVSVLTTLLTPYLIRGAYPLGDFLAKHMPARLTNILNRYTKWRSRVRGKNKDS